MNIAWLLLISTTLVSALQFCQLDVARKTDLCFAITSATNATTGKNDVSINLSVAFKERNGWAGIGIGDKMDGALMFVMYPGENDGDATMSFRTIDGHDPPKVTSRNPDIAAHTWVDGTNGLHHAQIMCYDCESWGGSNLSVDANDQAWIWAASFAQETRSDLIELMLNIHNDRGVEYLNMASSFIGTSELITAQVSEERVSSSVPIAPIVVGSPSGSGGSPKHQSHKHSLFGIVSLHGLILLLSFFLLTVGVLGIRSGMAKSFKLHWVIQAIGTGGIALGCLIGVYISFKHGGKFRTIHQLLGLLVFPTILVQALFGYLHHLNFMRYRKRTSISNYHVWIGRAILFTGNVNVCFGLSLGGASGTKKIVYYSVILLQVALLVPTLYFWINKGKTIRDVTSGRRGGKESGGVEYTSVEHGGEGDAFIVGDTGDEYELDEEEERDPLRRNENYEIMYDDEDPKDESKEET